MNCCQPCEPEKVKRGRVADSYAASCFYAIATLEKSANGELVVANAEKMQYTNPNVPYSVLR